MLYQPIYKIKEQQNIFIHKYSDIHSTLVMGVKKDACYNLRFSHGHYYYYSSILITFLIIIVYLNKLPKVKTKTTSNGC
jgi:hypothetical protein